jgi:hypothetical protein
MSWKRPRPLGSRSLLLRECPFPRGGRWETRNVCLTSPSLGRPNGRERLRKVFDEVAPDASLRARFLEVTDRAEAGAADRLAELAEVSVEAPNERMLVESLLSFADFIGPCELCEPETSAHESAKATPASIEVLDVLLGGPSTTRPWER